MYVRRMCSAAAESFLLVPPGRAEMTEEGGSEMSEPPEPAVQLQNTIRLLLEENRAINRDRERLSSVEAEHRALEQRVDDFEIGLSRLLSDFELAQFRALA